MKIEMSSIKIINPKPCNYSFGTRIYWDTAENTYLEVFTKKKHICPNRSTYNKNSTQLSSAVKPIFYKKPFISQQLKPKMHNSFELLSGSSVSDIQKQYEILLDVVRDLGGKVHCSQRDRDPKTSLLDLLVYYEVPEGMRKKVKQRYNNFIIKNIAY